MLVDVKDEVLAGEPLYNIKDAAGEITDGNVKIELGTEVLEEGTPLNKALLDKVTQNLIAYNVLDKYEDEVDEITGYTSGTENIFNSTQSQVESIALLDNDNVVVAFRDVANGYFGTFMIFDQEGNIVKDKVAFNSNSILYENIVKLKNGNFMIVYRNNVSDNYYGAFVIYDQDGNLVKSETKFSTSKSDYVSASIMENGNVFMACQGYTANSLSYGTFVIYDQDGNLVKGETIFNQGTTYSISVTGLKNGNVLVAYRKYGGSADDTGVFKIYNPNGELVKDTTTFNSTQIDRTKAATLKNGNVFIMFRDPNGLKVNAFVIYDEQGNLIKEKTSATAYDVNYFHCSAMENGNVLITFPENASYVKGCFAIYTSTGEIVQSQTYFNDNYTYECVGIETSKRSLFFAYRDYITSTDQRGSVIVFAPAILYNRNYKINGIGEPVLGEKLNIWNKSLDKTKTYLDYRIASGMCVTLANGNILQIYYDSTDSKPKYLVLDTDGNVIKEPVAYTSVTTSTMYACRLANDYVAIAYQNANSGARIQLLTPDGMSLYGSGFGVATATAIRSEGVKIAGLPNGNIFIVWSDTAGRTYYKITNTSGTEVKEQTTVSSTSYFWVGNLSGGKVVVGWTYDVSSGTDSTKFRIYKQDGSAYSAEMSVASTYSYKSGMIALGNDNFVIFIDNSYYFYNGANLQKSGTYAESTSTRPEAVKTKEGDIVTLYFSYRNSKYDGYYTIIDKTGNITKKDIIWGETDSTIYATPTNDGGVFVGYSPLTKDRMIALFLSRTNFVNTSKNSINGKPIDTILLEGFYQAIYDGEQYIAKEVGV